MTLPELAISNLPMQVTPADWPGGYWWHWLFFSVVLIGFMLTMVIGAIYIDSGKLQVGRALEKKDHGFAGDIGAGLGFYPLDFFGFGLNGFGGFYTYTGKYEGVYGVLTGLTGFLVLQI